MSDPTSALDHLESASPVSGHYVQVRGQVETPGEYLFRPEGDVLYYLKQAGGTNHKGDLGNLLIIRGTNGHRQSIKVNLDQSSPPPLVLGGDILVFHGVENTQNGNGNGRIISSLANGSTAVAAPSIPFSEAGNLPVELIDYIRSAAFKRVLNHLAAAQAETGFVSLAVLSQFPREGRSFVASAIALAYAKFLHSRVLIVDTVHQTAGNSVYLERVLGPAILHGETSAPLPGHVDMLSTRGKEESVESSDFQLSRYIQSLRRNYDLIVVDTCAISVANTATIDPLIVGRQVDAAMLVTSDRSLNRDTLTAVKQELTRFRVKAIGSVFNSGASR